MIDLASLLLFTAVADALVAIVTALAAASPGAPAWSGALAFRSLALVLLAGVVQDPGAVPIAAGCLAVSITLQAASLAEAGRTRLPGWIHAAAAGGVALPTALLAGDAATRIAFAGLVLGTLLAAAAVFALRLAPPAGWRSRSILSGCLALAAGIFFARGIAAAGNGDALQALLHPEGLAGAMLIAVTVSAVVSTSGFLLLQKEHADATAARLAALDPLTGAYNRRAFHEIGEREMARAQRNGHPLSVVMVDLDRFREVNEHHGHRGGDIVLQAVAQLLRATLRQEDLLVRFGGEQFLVFLPMVPGPGAVVVAGRLRRAIAETPIALEGAEVAVTASAGVAARLDEGPESMDEVIGRAEQALALAKRRGRNRVVALSLGRSIAA
ncbi:MAG TPA: GGDEF domain-containing protein [Usitatibacter sp.]|nr:GGDEF domain-containing protein [Usitatibacter sp.]